MIRYLNRLKAKKGFTLTELIIVIAIIGVLIAITVPALAGDSVPTKAKAVAKDVFYTTQDLMSSAKIATAYEIPSTGECFYAKVTATGAVTETGVVSDYQDNPAFVTEASILSNDALSDEYKALVENFGITCSEYLVDSEMNGTLYVIVDGSYRVQVAYWTDAPVDSLKKTPEFKDDYLLEGYYCASYPVNNSIAGAKMFVVS